MMYRAVISAFILSVLFSVTVTGQFAIFISPRAGLVSHTEGRVILGDGTKGKSWRTSAKAAD